jgi:protein TonB
VIPASSLPADTAPPAPLRPVALPPPPARGDELGAVGRRALVGGVLAAHLVGAWALMQVDAVRSAVAQAVPVLMVDMIAPPEPAKPPPPPPPAPPQRVAPTPAPVIAAAPSPTPAPAAFVAPPPEPTPPAPVNVAPAPPAPPAVAPAPPAPAGPRQIAPSAVRYVKLPELNFPALAKRARESGTVVLRITVDTEGRLKAATVQRSSGFASIDQAALSDIRSARFAPYMEDGKPVEWQTLAPLAYEL